MHSVTGKGVDYAFPKANTQKIRRINGVVFCDLDQERLVKEPQRERKKFKPPDADKERYLALRYAQAVQVLETVLALTAWRNNVVANERK